MFGETTWGPREDSEQGHSPERQEDRTKTTRGKIPSAISVSHWADRRGRELLSLSEAHSRQRAFLNGPGPMGHAGFVAQQTVVPAIKEPTDLNR